MEDDGGAGVLQGAVRGEPGGTLQLGDWSDVNYGGFFMLCGLLLVGFVNDKILESV